jgi:hypothetical protein
MIACARDTAQRPAANTLAVDLHETSNLSCDGSGMVASTTGCRVVGDT